MNISLSDYLVMVQELMPVVGYTEKQIEAMKKALVEGQISLENLSGNVAIQCFILGHQSANSDVVRAYLKEHQENKEVKFQ